MVTAEDQFNELSFAYAGTVAFASSDKNPFTSLPGSSVLTNGVGASAPP